MAHRLGTAAIAVTVLAGCAPHATVAHIPLAPLSVPSPTPTPTHTTAPPTPTASPRPKALPRPSFTWSQSRVTKADLPHSWRPGCPLGPDALRMLTVHYIGFDGSSHSGEIVVNVSAVGPVVGAFRDLYTAGFPIRRMVPVDVYGGSDDASAAADNTSGFNCRRAVSSGPPSWSQHAYGLAIDVNPVENPYLEGERVIPPAGAAFTNRSQRRPGMATAGGTLVRAFARHGWRWGGGWSHPDFQHFSANGR